MKAEFKHSNAGATLLWLFTSSMYWTVTAYGGLALANRRRYINSRVNLNLGVVEIAICQPNNQFIHEKNVLEVFPFYYLMIRLINFTLAFLSYIQQKC